LIGSLGDVVFEVSSESIRTFDALNIQLSAKYAQHDIHGRKGLLEFTGLDPAKLSFKIRLDAALGLMPKDELTALRGILEAGKAVPFVLDGEPQGWHLWVIESLSEEHKVLNNSGTLILAEVSLNLKEYVEDGGKNGS
jgi:phage protein U